MATVGERRRYGRRGATILAPLRKDFKCSLNLLSNKRRSLLEPLPVKTDINGRTTQGMLPDGEWQHINIIVALRVNGWLLD
jgi:hypothetical protein